MNVHPRGSPAVGLQGPVPRHRKPGSSRHDRGGDNTPADSSKNSDDTTNGTWTPIDPYGYMTWGGGMSSVSDPTNNGNTPGDSGTQEAYQRGRGGTTLDASGRDIGDAAWHNDDNRGKFDRWGHLPGTTWGELIARLFGNPGPDYNPDVLDGGQAMLTKLRDTIGRAGGRDGYIAGNAPLLVSAARGNGANAGGSDQDTGGVGSALGDAKIPFRNMGDPAPSLARSSALFMMPKSR